MSTEVLLPQTVFEWKLPSSRPFSKRAVSLLEGSFDFTFRRIEFRLIFNLAKLRGFVRKSCAFLHGLDDDIKAGLRSTTGRSGLTRKPVTILLVDDDADFRELTRMRLQASGFEVALASNGLEARNLVESCDPDVVIPDLFMPGLSGLDLLLKAGKGPSSN
jgi:hypothetical protein